MRVLHIANVAFLAGGAEKSIGLIRAGLEERGHSTAFLGTDLLRVGATTSDPEILATHMVRAPRGVTRPLRRLWNPETARAARGAIAEFSPDVVHLHTLGELSPSVLSATAHLPCVMTVHGPEDWIGAMLHWMFPSSSEGRLTRGDALRMQITRHVYRPLWLRQIRRLPLIITPSEYYAGSIRAEVPHGRVEVVRNGIPLPPAVPLRNHNRVVFVGRVHEGKGVFTLMDAMDIVVRENSTTQLVVVGDGPHLNGVRKRAAAHADRITVTGCVSREELRDHMQDATAILIPSVWPENFPTVALEAMGVGRAIIATRLGGLKELVEDGVNGVLFEPGDARGLADAINTVSTDEETAERMSAESAARASQFDVDVFVDKLLSIYADLVGSAGR